MAFTAMACFSWPQGCRCCDWSITVVWNSNGYESKLSTPVIGWLIHVNTENKLKSVVPQVLNFDPYPNVHKSVADCWLSDFFWVVLKLSKLFYWLAVSGFSRHLRLSGLWPVLDLQPWETQPQVPVHPSTIPKQLSHAKFAWRALNIIIVLALDN